MDHPNKVLVVAKREAAEFAMLADVPHVLAYEASATGAMRDVTAILHWSGSRDMLREAFLKCERLRWLHFRFAGIDATLFPELVASEVVVTNGRGVYSATLGEFALAAILYFAKDIPRLRRDQAARMWTPFAMERVEGQTVGIVGYGDIGRAVATRAHAMGMRILATKRHPPEQPDPLIERYYRPAELHAMLAVCDYVVVAAPLTAETRHMIGEAEFAAMKSSAVLMNVGRGPVVNTDALVSALTRKQIKGAGLDVVEPEPLPAGHALYGMENVLLSPHSADQVVGWKADAVRFFLEQYARFEKGEPLLNVVNKRLGY
ncbi:MAG: D-2-hydroxyacid dehydrogenase [Acidobacteriaceae bacterium]